MSKEHKFRNGRVIKAGDKAVGPDWFGRPVTGEIVAGEKPHHKPFALKHGTHGNICPSLDLSKFLHADDAAKAEKNASGGSPQQELKKLSPDSGTS